MAKRQERWGAGGFYGLVAARAPVAVVFRHRPNRWWHLMALHLDTGELEHGAWFHGTLYPRRADVSADGRLLCYFAYKVGGGDFLGQRLHHTYVAVSRVPWLFALTAWREIGTYTRGYHFVEGEEARVWDVGPPGGRRGMARTEPEQYAAERRRGWVEHERCPPRVPGDVWDQEREVVLAKARPGGPGRLVLTDHGFQSSEAGCIERMRPTYAIEVRGRCVALDDAAWAEWDAAGRLVVVTHMGKLQLLDPDGHEPRVIREHDVRDGRPAPRPAPEHARRW